MAMASRTGVSLFIRPSDGMWSPAKACAQSCGFGCYIGPSKMVPYSWVGVVHGRDMKTMRMIMSMHMRDLI